MFATLVISLLLNLFAIIYIRWLLVSVKETAETLEVLQENISQFTVHLREIYELEMFYGDETLKSLISHTVSLSELLEDYEDIYSITEPLLEEDEEEIYGEQIDAEETNSQEKDVLYAGSRKRDP